MNFELTKEQKIIQQTAKEYAEKNLAPLFKEHEKNHFVPLEVFQGLGELGFMGLPITEKYGGSEAGYDAFVLMLEQIVKYNSAVGGIITGHTLPLCILNAFGSDEQKKRYLPGGCNGTMLHTFAFTEPGTGSDPKQITCTAKKDGDSWVLNGTKRFISNANYPGVMVVVVKDVDSGKLCTFLVEKFSEGYSISEPWKKIAKDAQGLYDVYLKDCRVPAENLVGAVGEGFKHLVSGIGYGKLGIATTSLAEAQHAYELGVEYAMTKTHRGEPISKFQAVQLLIAEMAEKVEACRLMVYKAASVGNSNVDFAEFAKRLAMTKNYVCQTAVDVVRASMEIHAAYGLVEDYEIEKLWRQVIMEPQIEGAPHIQRIMVAKAIINSYK